MAAKVNENDREQPTLEQDLDMPEDPKGKKKKKVKKEKSTNVEGVSVGIGIKIAVLVVVLLGVLGSVVYFNVLGVREKYLRSVLERIPIVSNILSPLPEDDPYAGLSKGELFAEIEKLTAELANKDGELAQAVEKSDYYAQELARLQDIEAQQIQFKQDKEAFDRQIAEGDSNAYKAYFEQISPENQEPLYQETAAELKKAAEIKKFYNTISSMDESSVAKIMEQLVTPGNNMDLVVSIIRNLDSETSAGIISAMKTEIAAEVVERLPQQQIE